MDQAPQVHLERWGLRQDGEPWAGWTSRVWPVRGPRGQQWALKVLNVDEPAGGEGAALRAWHESGARGRVVALIDEHDGALLLERLDAKRCLADHPIEDADQVIAESLVALTGVPPPPGVPCLTDELRRLGDSITSAHSRRPDLLPDRVVARALDGLRALTAHLTVRPQTLVHYDLHYLNVLRDLEDRRWVVIDPLPRAGVPEVEVVPALRNRWEDLMATGDPERAMQRRFDLLTDAAGLDRELAAMFAQSVAVDNLLWLLPREPRHMFVASYTLLSRW